jgi:hypothetical protein
LSGTRWYGLDGIDAVTGVNGAGMGHSMVDFQGRHVLLDDADLILVAHAALDASGAGAADAVPAAGLHALLESWRGLMDVYGPGCVELGLDRFIVTDADRAALAALLSATKRHLREQGTVLTAEYLNRIVGAPGVLLFHDRQTDTAVGAVQRVETVLGPAAPA